jgi:hypothetical protein
VIVGNYTKDAIILSLKILIPETLKTDSVYLEKREEEILVYGLASNRTVFMILIKPEEINGP